MNESQTSPAIVDLKTQAVDLAGRLSTLTHFLEAAQMLLTCNNLPSNVFQRFSRKIITLTEIARKTLISAHISLHLFVTCSPQLAPLKAAYVGLLKMLQERYHDIDVSLHGRFESLIAPLSSGFIIQRKGDPPLPLLTPRKRARIPEAYSRPVSKSHEAENMPPPSKFPTTYNFGYKPKSRPRKVRDRIWDPEDVMPTQTRLKVEQENLVPLLARPPSWRFGIFCTGKSSMNQPQERVGRVRTIRPIREQ